MHRCSIKLQEPKRINRANKLSGKDWLKKSISIWTIKKSNEEKALDHPAIFPVELVQNLLLCFANPNCKIVLDPFCGVGSTLVAACKLNYFAIGFEIYEKYIQQAEMRLTAKKFANKYKIYKDSALNIVNYIQPGTVDIAITSPPYWNILNRKRTVDRKKSNNYGKLNTDIGNINDYFLFLKKLTEILVKVATTLRSGAYFLINVMDIRVKSKFYPFHSDLYYHVERNTNMFLDDIIIWDRRMDYNNLKPLGYPYKFRINRVHEYILIFQKK